MRTIVRNKCFPIKVGLHPGLSLSPDLFASIVDELTRHVQDEVP